jgi:calcium permeable stress-gated cation channel
LGFINSIPSVILGVITGLLPTVMLALLMAMLPVWLRFLAKTAGLPTLSQIELRLQTSYFWFQVCTCYPWCDASANVLQVIQVFLVTTLSSAVSSAIQPILDNPVSVTSLLAENLPLASNFYINYFILQGLVCKYFTSLERKLVTDCISRFWRPAPNCWVDTVQTARCDS